MGFFCLESQPNKLMQGAMNIIVSSIHYSPTYAHIIRSLRYCARQAEVVLVYRHLDINGLMNS